MEDNQAKNKNLRLLEHFANISESTFWPSEIHEIMCTLKKDLTFEELNSILEQDFIDKMNNMTMTSRRFKNDYDSCLKDLHDLKNTFSYDIDFI